MRIQDRDGAGSVLDKIRRRYPWLELIWVDGGPTTPRQVHAEKAKVPLVTSASRGASSSPLIRPPERILLIETQKEGTPFIAVSYLEIVTPQQAVAFDFGQNKPLLFRGRRQHAAG